MNYQILVNKSNKVSQDLIDTIEMVEFISVCMDEPLFIEKETCNMFNKLKEYVYEQKRIVMELKYAYRTPLESEEIYDEFKVLYGEEYAIKHVAPPYASEHNTGLACDYTIKKDGSYIDENMDGFEALEEVEYVNSVAYKFGFILRYPKGKEDITGYNFEPWHLRYVGKELAATLFNNCLTMEEYFC